MKDTMTVSLVLALQWFMVACGDDEADNPDGNAGAETDTDIDTDRDSDSDTDSTAETDTETSSNTTIREQPMCVYNQAYQENWEKDSISFILSNAKNCYVLVDPFGENEDTEITNAIPKLKENGNVVGCYISSGTCENWRADFSEMKSHCVDTSWGQWEGEYFVDQPRNNSALLDLMFARIDKMASWGCEMVEFDNMDWAFDEGYRAEYKFGATAQDGIDYNNALCDYTHSLGMLCMAKNTRQGAANFDGGTFESYDDDKNWWDPEHLLGFLRADQPGIIIHYNEANCIGVYNDYQKEYGGDLSFICESADAKAYVHFNE